MILSAAALPGDRRERVAGFDSRQGYPVASSPPLVEHPAGPTPFAKVNVMASDNINIAGLDKAELLSALYSRAQVLGMGALNAKAGDLTPDEAAVLVTRHTQASSTGRTSCYFDYLHGRVMKVDIGGDTLNGRMYDRDNGAGAAERIVAALRAKTAIPGQPTTVPPRPADPEAFANEIMGQIQIVTL